MGLWARDNHPHPPAVVPFFLRICPLPPSFPLPPHSPSPPNLQRWILILVFAVSLLHALFDFLAFKNDVSFWNNIQSMAGLSRRSLVIDLGCQIVVFLYLKHEDSSMLVLAPAFIGIGIQTWKVRRVFSQLGAPAATAVVVAGGTGGGGEEPGCCRRFCWCYDGAAGDAGAIVGAGIAGNAATPGAVSAVSTARERKKEAKKQAKLEKLVAVTREADRVASMYLGYFLYPMLAGYAAYSLLCVSHESLYAWLINSAVGMVYTFGFIAMTPQLFINYKLKSVAHLPWKFLMYRSLNTFIDDLFAFVIKMPTMHRLSCFRGAFGGAK